MRKKQIIGYLTFVLWWKNVWQMTVEKRWKFDLACKSPKPISRLSCNQVLHWLYLHFSPQAIFSWWTSLELLITQVNSHVLFDLLAPSRTLSKPYSDHPWLVTSGALGTCLRISLSTFLERFELLLGSLRSFAAKIYEMNLQMEVIQKGFAASVKEWNTRWLNVAFAL